MSPQDTQLYTFSCIFLPKIKLNTNVLAATLKEDQILGFKTVYRLMQVKSIAECPKIILQYFRPTLSYHLSLRSFCLFLSGHFSDGFYLLLLKKPILAASSCMHMRI